MTIDEGIREKINNAISNISGIEIINFPGLPIKASDLANQSVRHFITAYCYNCKQETNHIIYPYIDDWSTQKIHIKCHVCENDLNFGNVIHQFVKMYCPECETRTVHAIYYDNRSGTYIKCLGCGRKVKI